VYLTNDAELQNFRITNWQPFFSFVMKCLLQFYLWFWYIVFQVQEYGQWITIFN